jgi:hypothetical protein
VCGVATETINVWLKKDEAINMWLKKDVAISVLLMKDVAGGHASRIVTTFILTILCFKHSMVLGV